MSAPGPGLACLEVGSIALGYVCLAKASARAEVEILEASIVGGARFMILLRGPAATLAEAMREAQKTAISSADGDAPVFESCVLDREPTGFLQAMYSLADIALEETLVVCEASSMSAMLAASEALLAGGAARAIEIKPLRGPSGGAIGFFTGAPDACGLAAEGARSRLRAGGHAGRVEAIDRPPSAFRARFSPDGRA